ncbi:glycosyltransferase [Candidatus Pelagibacter sp.]|nr:glycosyltransferase [Candidatus Pelagibacter sp.]
MKKILHIVNGNVSGNARNIYEIVSLAKKKFDVTVVSENYIPKLKIFKKFNIKVIVFKKHESTLSNKILWHFFLVDYNWLNFLNNKLKNQKFDYISIQNNYLGKTILKFKKVNKLFSAKIIFDIHDSLPESYISWNKNRNIFARLIFLLFTNTYRLRNYENYMIKNSYKTLVTCIESKKKMINFYSDKIKNKIIVINNLESKEFQKKFKVKLKKTKKIRVLYFGGFAPHRGIKTLIESAFYLDKKKYEIYIIGSINNQYSKMIHKMNRPKNVKILKKINLKNLKKFLNDKTIGIVPHDANMHTNTTVPYKLSQYMSLGLPQLVSDCDPLKRIIKDSHSGIIFKSSDKFDLKEKILSFKIDLIRNLRKNSLNYFNKNNWESCEENTYLKIYE